MVHVRTEEPPLTRIVQEHPDVVDVNVVLPLEERVGGQPVAQLVALPVDAAPVGEHQRLGDLLQRNPQVDQHQRGFVIVDAG